MGLLIACVMVVGSLTLFAIAQSIISVTIDGREVIFKDVQPQIIDGRTMVPIRFIAEELGYDVEWNQDKQTVEISTAIKMPTSTIKQLGVGTVSIYDFGSMKIHDYTANDGLGDETILIETATNMIAIDVPSFKVQLTELVKYTNDINKSVTDLIIGYHPFGGDYFQGAKVYSAEALIGSSAETGMGANFANSFGDAFATSVPKADVVLKAGKTTIGGVEMVIYSTGDGCDIEIPAINAIFVHMNGSKTHSILGSIEDINTQITKLKGYATKNYNFVLTSHDKLETGKAITEKIAYLERAKEIIASSNSIEEFTVAMKTAFPEYQGEHYLGMSAGMIYGE